MQKNLEQKLKSLNVAIVTHIFATGPALDLEEYLKGKVNSLLFVGHPFSFRKETNSFYRSYSNGQLVAQHKAYSWRLPGSLFYLKDVFYTLWWALHQPKKIDLYIGSDNFCTFLGLLLKRIGRVNNVVLYTIDYLPDRFGNPLLNWFYHFFDYLCLKYCKVVWNVSPVMASAREKYRGVKVGDSAPQIIVPLGMWYKRIPKLSISKKEQYRLVFIGHLLAKQGLDVVIEAMPNIIEEIPRAELLVMGTGEYETTLKGLVEKLGLSPHVTFTGYIEKHEDIEQELARSTVAVAMYKPDPKSFTRWADPGKLKNYLAAGLPIILTGVPPIAGEIEAKRCGFVVPYKTTDFARAAIRLLSDRKLLGEYSSNAREYARQFDWDTVFSEALRKTVG